MFSIPFRRSQEVGDPASFEFNGARDIDRPLTLPTNGLHGSRLAPGPLRWSEVMPNQMTC
jgi:hypothetical protein